MYYDPPLNKSTRYFFRAD